MTEEEKKLIEEYVSAAKKLNNYLVNKAEKILDNTGHNPIPIGGCVYNIYNNRLCDSHQIEKVTWALKQINKWLEEQ